MLNNETKIQVSDLNVFYGDKQAIFDINMSINSKEVTAVTSLELIDIFISKIACLSP